MKKAFLKTLKYFSLTLLSLVMLVVAIVLLIVARPQFVINDHTLEVAANYARKLGLADIHWKSGHVHVESLAFLRKRISFDFAGLCVNKADGPELNACFKVAQITAAVSFAGFKPILTELGPVNIQGGEIFVRPGASDKPYSQPPLDEKNSKQSFALSPVWAHTQVFPLNVGIDHWKVQNGATALSGMLDLSSKADVQGHAHVKADLTAESREGLKAPHQVEAKLEMDNPEGFFSLETWKLGAQASALLADGTRAHVNAHVDPRVEVGSKGKSQNLVFDYTMNAGYSKGKGHATVESKGLFSPDEVQAHLSAQLRNLVPQLPQIEVKDCDLKIARAGTEIEPGSVKVDCPLRARIPMPPKGFPDLKVPTEIGGRVTAELKSSAYPPAADSFIDGRVGLVLDPILSPIFQGDGTVASQISGIPAEFPKNWKMDTDLGLRLKVVHFDTLVDQLANGPLAVWAPLRVLKGAIEFAIQGKFDANSGTAPVSFKTRLAAGKQKLNLDANGTLQVERFLPSPLMNLKADLALTDVQLQLPPMPNLPTPSSPKPDELPRFFPDGRIHSPVSKNQPKKSEHPLFSYDVTIHTPSAEKPLHLLTPQISTPIPIAVNIGLSNTRPMSGSVRVQTLPLQLFKRDVTLDHITVSLKDSSDDNELDGEIKIPYTNYTITVLLLGTTSKPQVRFLSDPPLPENQILATLVFGEPIDALDPDQQRSISDTRAALWDGAFSLFSLYYLSALNIERIDYNPETKTASLRYRLGQGTSLQASQAENERSIGIRKRLSKHLAITTSVNDPSNQANKSISTFLEWAYQY